MRKPETGETPRALSPVYAMGAYFGNDQIEYAYDFTHTKLSIFDNSNNLLGSVDVPANFNTSLDQFIGIRSLMPFTKARFENFRPDGNPSIGMGIILDDLTIEPVPEPNTFALFAVSAVVFGSVVKLKRKA